MRKLSLFVTVAIFLLASAARAEPAASQPKIEDSLQKLCLKAYIESSLAHPQPFGGISLTDAYEQIVAFQNAFADTLDNILKNVNDEKAPSLKEARRLRDVTREIAGLCKEMLDRKVFEPGSRLALERLGNREYRLEIEQNNIIMKFTYERLGRPELFEPRKPFDGAND